LLHRKKYYLIAIFFLVFVSLYGFSEARDPSYIGDYEQRVTLYGKMYQNLLELSIEGNDDLSYNANNIAGLGVGISCRDYRLSLEFCHDIGVTADKEYPKTQIFDLQIHKYTDHFIFDILFQQYKGFYRDDGTTLFTYPGLSLFLTGVTGQYVFNSKYFSSRAAYALTEKQLKSAGTFLLGSSFYYYSVNTDEIHDDILHSVQGFQCGVNAGYAYNWVVRKKWLINLSLSIGVDINNSSIDTFFDHNLRIAPLVLPKFSCSYNKESWSLGMVFIANTITAIMEEDADLELDSGRLNVVFLKRL